MPDSSWITPELLNKMIDEAKSHPSRIDYLDSLKRGWKWYKKKTSIVPDDEFDDIEIDKRHATSRDNVIKETVDEGVSLLLKYNPIVRTYPTSGRAEDSGLADDMDEVRLSTWIQSHTSNVEESMLQEAMICGLSIGKIYWNPNDRRVSKKGDIATVKLPPQSVFIDPFATNDHRLLDVRYIIHKSRQPISVILHRYGTEAAIALGLRDNRGRKLGKMAFIGRYLNQTAKQVSEYINPTGSSTPNTVEKVEECEDVYECWIFPATPFESDLVIGDNMKDDGYPYGVVAIMINDKVVKIKPNPFRTTHQIEQNNEYGLPMLETVEVGAMRHPFVPQYWLQLADEDGNNNVYYCMGLVEPMIPLQFSIDAIRRNIEINARSTANPGGLVNPDAFDFAVSEQMTIGPGEYLPVKSGYDFAQAIYRLEGQQLPQYVFELLSHSEMNIKRRVGFGPGVTSMSPLPSGTSHTPTGTIGTIQEAAFGPLWRYVKEISNTVLDFSILIDGLIQQFYEEGRFIDVTRDGIQRHIEWTKRHITANFRREVVTGATTPVHDIERSARVAEIAAVCNQALQTNDTFLIRSTIYYLKNINYPYAYDWIQLLNEKLQFVKQQQEELEQVGAEQLGRMANQQSPAISEGAIPPESGLSERELSGLQALSSATGLTADQIFGNQ